MAQLVRIAFASLLVGLAPVCAQTDPLAGGAFVEFGASHDLLASDLMGTDLSEVRVYLVITEEELLSLPPRED